MTYSAYNAALISHNVLVKAKNFLVFQGDVEAVASQSPRELAHLIEQISGSLELAAEYEKAKQGQERATENATFNFTKRRGIAGEIKQYKEQKGEAERFESLCDEKVCSAANVSVSDAHSPKYRIISSFAVYYSGYTIWKNRWRIMPAPSSRRTKNLQSYARNRKSMKRHLKRRVRIKPKPKRPLCKLKSLSKKRTRCWKAR